MNGAKRRSLLGLRSGFRYVLIRVRRLRPSRLSGPVLTVALLTWVTMLGCGAWILFGARGGATALDTQWVPRLLVTLGVVAVVMASTLALVLRRSRSSPLTVRIALGLTFLGNLLPARALLADAEWVLSALSAGCAMAALGLAAWAARTGRGLRAVVAAAVAAMGWIIPLLVGIGAPSGSSLWMLLVVTAYPVFLLLATFAVAEAAESRLAADQVRSLSADVSIPILLTVLVIKISLLVARFTVAKELFGSADGQLWTLRSWTSWPHAVLVAALFALLAWRSWRRPLNRRGQRLLTAGLTIGAASIPAAVVADQVVSALRVTRPLVSVSDALVSVPGTSVPLATNEWFFQTSHWWAVGIVIAAGIVMGSMPAFRGSAGRAQSAVAAVYLLPPVLAIALLEDFPDLDLPTIWSSPVQVDVALTAIVACLIVGSLVARRRLAPGTLMVKLLAGLFLAIHAAVALPALLENALTAPLIIGGSAIALFGSLPLPPANVTEHAVNVLRASWRQAAFFVLYVLVLLVGLEDSSRGGVIAVLWLAVPVSFGICLRVRESASTVRATPATDAVHGS